MNPPPDAHRFPYQQHHAAAGESGLLPIVPLTLTHRGQSIPAEGLLDSGATVNVLPYRLGLKLGLDWDALTTPVTLTGNLAHFPARALVLTGVVDSFPAVRLAFAWSRTDDIPLVLGQVNFFMEFDLCLYRSKLEFYLIHKNIKSL